MSKARTLANLISDNAELADGQISVAEVVGAAPTANPTFTGTATGTFSGPLTGNVTGDLTGDIDLSAIAATISDTAVDVFVYDTSKDSDGGAWRKRTQNTSWYNETLNTATRGSRKEFPAVAVIVAESNQVTIYDGDDPDLPMWMVFNCNAGSVAMLQASTIKAVSALNGVLQIASDVYGAPQVRFLEDNGDVYWNSSSRRFTPFGIADRNANDSPISNDTSRLLVNSNVNDVAMTVLPNAPIDAATGLPVPTIAVATNGGVSVIKDDGTVADIAITSTLVSRSDSIAFVSNDGDLLVGHGTVMNGRRHSYIYPLPTSDTNTANWYRTDLCDGTTTTSNLKYTALAGAVNKVTNNKKYTTALSGNYGHLTLLDENVSNPQSSCIGYVNTTYNTGWMNGDIKLATLSDTDDTDVVAETKINEAFATTPSWNTSGSGPGTWSANGTLSCSGATTFSNYFWKSFSVEAGKTYTATVKVAVRGNRSYLVKIGTTSTGGEVGILANSDGAGTHSLTFTATANDTYYYTFQEGAGSTANTWDDATVRLAEEDRSVNGNGLQVFGTVTKNPVATGADLVAYSGFSSSNYLEQPYNSDLDFGTGDFCVMGWSYPTAIGTHARTFVSRYTSNGDTGWNVAYHTDGSLYFYTTNSGAATYGTTTGGPYVTTNVWQHLVFTRTSGVLSVYKNGVLVKTTVGTVRNVTDASAVLRISNQHSLVHADPGKMALWRISATVPSPEQIKKIYNDEKVLFQEGAQATLYGSSDAVTALAYDDATDLLHVGTSAGRSDFQGLRRVNNTTNAVGAAISASNGMIVEE